MILDASAAAMFLLLNEREPTPELTNLLEEGPLLVPQHWGTEIGSMLVNAERRHRLDRSGRDRAVLRVSSWAVQVDDQTTDRVWSTTLALADAHDLTIYDAAYLELALRSGESLASNDRDLIDAARACGVEVLTSLS